MSAAPAPAAAVCLHVSFVGDGNGNLTCANCHETRPVAAWAKALAPTAAPPEPLRARVVWSGPKPGGVHALKLHVLGVGQPAGALDALEEADEVLVMPAPPRAGR